MYRWDPKAIQPPEEFELPFGGKLSSENRWVTLSSYVPWEEFEAEYAKQLSATEGAPAKPFRMALGALIIKERLNTTDAETVEQIRENPYLQYFVGLTQYTDEAPFEASMLVHFRKRITREMVGRINERIVEKIRGIEGSKQLSEVVESEGEAQKTDEEAESEESGQEGEAQKERENQGEMILDATCAPSDISYPTDLKLLNEGRQHTERIIDELHEQLKSEHPKKPRTYRQKAHREYLNLSKQKRPSARKRRKGIGKQLNYIRRNLSHIDRLLEAGASLSALSRRQYRQLLVVRELYRQQRQMYEQRSHRIEDRIVSLSQPHVRPIVRGKAGRSTEFGAKLSASCCDGFIFLDRLSWDNFNESGDLIFQAQSYRRRFGHYPQTIYADAIYRTRANRNWCRHQGIRLMGPPLGRPAASQKAALAKQTREDEKIRNHIEGKFGQAKRRFSLSRVMAKLDNTAETVIAISFLVMNLERLLQQVFYCLFSRVVTWIPLFDDSVEGLGVTPISTPLITSMI